MARQLPKQSQNQAESALVLFLIFSTAAYYNLRKDQFPLQMRGISCKYVDLSEHDEVLVEGHDQYSIESDVIITPLPEVSKLLGT